MYATIVPGDGDLTLACHGDAIVVGSRAEMDAQPGTTVYLPDLLATVPVGELSTPIAATPWDPEVAHAAP